MKCGCGKKDFDESAENEPSNCMRFEYTRKLECEYNCMQKAFFELTVQYSRMQFILQQLLQAPFDDRRNLFADLKKIVSEGMEQEKPFVSYDALPQICDFKSLGDVRRKRKLLIQQLRDSLDELSSAPMFDDNTSREMKDKPPPPSKPKRSTSSPNKGKSASETTMTSKGKKEKEKEEEENVPKADEAVN